MGRGPAAHRDRIALLMAAHRAGVLDFRYSTPLPHARYVVAAGGHERALRPADVLPYVAGLADAGNGSVSALLADWGISGL